MFVDALRVGVFLDGEGSLFQLLTAAMGANPLDTDRDPNANNQDQREDDQDLRWHLRAVETGVTGDQLKQPRQYGYGPGPEKVLEERTPSLELLALGFVLHERVTYTPIH
ncbi:hypothetical protein [Prescottella equi]|uniref:hypothetical protein n=1 Tax=Rhodococcus hoagii TaxID=43767 RepID=UPI00131D858A|nr:hypothetical protein [Prescottella equi]